MSTPDPLENVSTPDPLPLRCIKVPAEVTRVDGCDCGGLEWHREDCTIWAVPYEQARAAADAAYAREQEFTDALNSRLKEVTGM